MSEQPTTIASAESRALRSVYTDEAKKQLRELAMEYGYKDPVTGETQPNYGAAMKIFWRNPQVRERVKEAFAGEASAEVKPLADNEVREIVEVSRKEQTDAAATAQTAQTAETEGSGTGTSRRRAS